MSATEGTVNTLMSEYLRSHGIEITTEVSFQTQQGRRQVDFRLQNGGDFYGEGEWQSSYITGYNQAIEYGEITGAAGYFLIGYPDELENEIEQERLSDTDPETLLSGYDYRAMFKPRNEPPSIFEGSVEQLPQFTKKAKQEEEKIEDTDAYINLMRDIVSGLTNYIPDAEEYPSLFEHIIAAMPENEEETSAATDAAAYLLLNQVVFYRILEKQGFDRIQPSKIDRPEDLHEKYFTNVLEKNYEAIFDLDVYSLIPQRAVPYLQDMIKIVNELQPEQFTRDLLGSAFHELIPLEVRKPVAAYYTNPNAARILGNITVEQNDDSVADFACGSGTLLMSAYEKKKRKIRGSMTEEVHRTFVQDELTGVDIMPFAAHLAAVQLGLRNSGFYTDKPRIAIQDSTTLKPNTTIDALQQTLPSGQSKITEGWTEEDIENRSVETGATSASGEGSEFHLDPVDVVLMNPPFTRKQHITSDYRDTVDSRFSEYSDYIDSEMGFYCYFFLLADRFLESGGRIGMVVPSVILQQSTTEGIRKLLQEKYSIEHIVLSEYRSAFSEDTSKREILLIAEKHGGDSPVSVSSLDILPSQDEVEEITGAIRGEPNKLGDNIERAKIPQSEFDKSLNWMSLVREEVGFYYEYPDESPLEPLNTQINGIIGGMRLHDSSDYMNNKDALLSKDRDAQVPIDWEVQCESDTVITAQSQYTAATVDVPKNRTEWALRSVSGIRTMRLTHPYDWVVNSRFDDDGSFWATDADDVLDRRRDHVDSRLSDIILAGYGNVDLTADGTSHLAIAPETPTAPTWTLWSVQTESSEDAKLLTLFYNSTFCLAKLLTERNEERGSVMKWRQGDLKDLPVVDLSQLDDENKEKLIDVYDKVASQDFPALVDQLNNNFEPRKKIDQTWARILDWETFEAEEEIEKLHDQVAGFLIELGEMMEND
jgi:type I restriction-modification system DNA methylase subunit